MCLQVGGGGWCSICAVRWTASHGRLWTSLKWRGPHQVLTIPTPTVVVGEHHRGCDCPNVLSPGFLHRRPTLSVSHKVPPTLNTTPLPPRRSLKSYQPMRIDTTPPSPFPPSSHLQGDSLCPRRPRMEDYCIYHIEHCTRWYS